MTELLVRLHGFDERLLRRLVLSRLPRLDVAARGVTHLGDAWVAIALALGLLLPWSPFPDRVGVEAALTLGVSHLFVQLLKRTAARERPRLPVGVQSLVEAPDRFSFPSGHSAASMSIALPLALALPMPLAAPILALAFAVGLSRCYLGVHYPGDVLVGWCLALLTLGAGRLLLPV